MNGILEFYNEKEPKKNMDLIEIADNYDPANPSEEIDLCIAYVKKMELQYKLFDERIKEKQNRYTEQTGDKTPRENNLFKMYYRNGSVRTNIDSTRLKKERPDIAKEYSKTTETKGGWVWELK